MRKIAIASLSLLTMLSMAMPSRAAVTVTTTPTSLVTSIKFLRASSSPLALFKFALGADASETLSSVTVQVDNTGTSTVTSAEFAGLSVYRDDGDGIFEPGVDTLINTAGTVNLGATTAITTDTNNSLPGTFFVTMATSASWNDSDPVDSVIVTLPVDGVVTSANSPTITEVMTTPITADTTGPQITIVQAKDTGSTATKTAGDSIDFTFDEATNKPTLTPTQLASTLGLSSSHSLLDGLGLVLNEAWNTEGTILTVTLSSNISIPTVEVGDTVTIQGALITDAVGNSATGSQTITGSFITDVAGPVLSGAQAKNTGGTSAVETGDTVELAFNEATNKPAITKDNIMSVFTVSNSHSFLDSLGNIGGASWSTDGKKLTITLSANPATSILPPTIIPGDTITIQGSVIKDLVGNLSSGSQVLAGTFGTTTGGFGFKHGKCDNGLKNGRLYRVSNDSANTLYLAVNCKLKVFTGRAMERSHGRKFRNVLTLASLDGITVAPLLTLKFKHREMNDHGKNEGRFDHENRGRGKKDD